MVDTVAAGELAVDAALVDLEAALCGGHSGSRVSWQWMQLWWIWRLRCVVDTVAAGELAAVDAALVDLEAALCGGHSGSSWAGLQW